MASIIKPKRVSISQRRLLLRILEPGVRVLTPVNENGHLYLGTVVRYQNSRVQVRIDRGGGLRTVHFTQVTPVESWRWNRLLDPELPLLQKPLKQLFRYKMTVKYDLAAVEAIWTWFNHRVFGNQLQTPNFRWTQEYRWVASWVYRDNTLYINRGHNLTINALAESIGHEIIHMFQTNVLNISDDEKFLGGHGETFKFWRERIRVRTGISVPIDRAQPYHPDAIVGDDFWENTGNRLTYVFIAEAGRLQRIGGRVGPGWDPDMFLIEMKKRQPGLRANIYEVNDDPRIVSALVSLTPGIRPAPINPLLEELVKRTGRLLF